MPLRTRTTGAESVNYYSGSFAITGSNIPAYGTTSRPPGTLILGGNEHVDTRSSITDVTGSPGVPHSCTHKKRVLGGASQTRFRYKAHGTVAPNLGTISMDLACNQAISLATAACSTHLVVPDGAGVANGRVPSTCPELVDGVNALYELKDLRSMVDRIPLHLLWAAARNIRSTETKRELDKWLANIRKTCKSPALLLQELIGVDLMWKFGLAPMVKDVNSIHSMLGSLDAKLKALMSKTFTFRGMHREVKASNAFAKSGFLTSPAWLELTSTTSINTTVQWISGVIRRLNPDWIEDIDLLRLALMRDSLGLSLDATDIWQAVPYSFVVDWFLPISNFLDQFARGVDPGWLVTDGWWQTKKSSTIVEVRCSMFPYGITNLEVDELDGNIHVAGCQLEDYQRSVLTTAPPWASVTYVPQFRFPGSDKVGLSKWFTGLELVLQRFSSGGRVTTAR